MSDVRPELNVFVRLGGHVRQIPLAALAAMTHQSTSALREHLSRLVFALIDHDATDASIPRGDLTEGERSPREPGANVQKRKENGNVLSDVPVPAHTASPADTITARTLVEALDDPRSAAYFRHLVATESQSVLAAALAETHAHRTEIRGAPGAYFVGVLRALKRTQLTHPSSYACTPPDPSRPAHPAR